MLFCLCKCELTRCLKLLIDLISQGFHVNCIRTHTSSQIVLEADVRSTTLQARYLPFAGRPRLLSTTKEDPFNCWGFRQLSCLCLPASHHCLMLMQKGLSQNDTHRRRIVSHLVGGSWDMRFLSGINNCCSCSWLQGAAPKPYPDNAVKKASFR